ncbi:hypothetical protein [uncultured Prevotella sp.]|uniref:hypothetical protein n=1 Tax=uncultured Prevotella sp. TaxID=159272 RepID=UPI002631730A|nr:hypothetical protein [uncultured Prevotella sp.]
MKTLKIIICLLLAFTASASADNLTPAQKDAQLKLYSYLQKNKYEPSVDTSDNSVCFRRGGVLYWITFEENSPILYTFHRKAFKVGTDESSYKRRPSIIAANEVNRRHKTVKLTVEDKKVDIAIQVYAAKTEDFTAVFSSYFSRFDNVDSDFRNEYQIALKAERESADRIEEEARKNLPPSVLANQIVNASFRLLDADGVEKTAYDQPLRSFNARYIQVRLEFAPWKEKDQEFDLQIKVTRPNGKPIYLPGKKVTAEMTVTLEKSRKNQMIEFDQFGSPKEGFWKAGEYKVEVMEAGDVIYTTTFNIL